VYSEDKAWVLQENGAWHLRDGCSASTMLYNEV